MKKERYSLYIDGYLAYTSNRVTVLKKRADEEFEIPYTFYAKIMDGNRLYADRRYDSKWHNWGTAKIAGGEAK